MLEIIFSNLFKLKRQQSHPMTDSLSEQSISCRNKLQKEYYNKLKQNNNKNYKISDLNL